MFFKLLLRFLIVHFDVSNQFFECTSKNIETVDVISFFTNLSSTIVISSRSADGYNIVLNFRLFNMSDVSSFASLIRIYYIYHGRLGCLNTSGYSCPTRFRSFLKRSSRKLEVSLKLELFFQQKQRKRSLSLWKDDLSTRH